MIGTGRRVTCIGAALLALSVGACGGSSSAKVGDCIDAQKKVVDCNSSGAAQRLVSDQDRPNATACLLIGDKPQTEVKVGDKTFCAEPK